MSLKWFSKLSRSIPALSPSSNTTHQLISRDFNGSELKRVRKGRELKENMMRVRSASRSAATALLNSSQNKLITSCSSVHQRKQDEINNFYRFKYSSVFSLEFRV